jgi:hypothetical protein
VDISYFCLEWYSQSKSIWDTTRVVIGGFEHPSVGFAICAAVFQMSTCGVGKSHSPVPLLTRGVSVVSSGM